MKYFFLFLVFFLELKIWANNDPYTDYDVHFYDIKICPNLEQKTIEGEVKIHFKILNTTDKIAFDLSDSLSIKSIYHHKTKLYFTRSANKVFVHFGKPIEKNQLFVITIQYKGKPIEAKNPPWEGGLVWKKTEKGEPFIGVACQHIGSGVWFPSKQDVKDKADSVQFSCRVPKNLRVVSNGRAIAHATQNPTEDEFIWKTNYPITSYNITFYIAPFEEFKDFYLTESKKKLALEYYVLAGNTAQAQNHFLQVKTMLAAYEKYFGEYPFIKEGFALVEAPYWGMEHQTAVAYGNHFKNNDFGFDFIIIHEAAHEYWGNSLTCTDPAEFWIHESLATYSEALFVEEIKNYTEALRYLQQQRIKIRNQKPILGTYNTLYNSPDTDLYYKGAWMFHTLRHVIDDESLWKTVFKELSQLYRYDTITTDLFIQFFEAYFSKDLAPIFNQYLNHADPPVLEYITDSLLLNDKEMKLNFRWEAGEKNFDMPIDITIDGQIQRIEPTQKWAYIFCKKGAKIEFLTDKYYFLPKEVKK